MADPINTSDKTFNEALGLVLKYEGNFSDNKLDHGGSTNKGITQVNYDRYRATAGKSLQSVEFIEDEEVKYIYYENYWLTGKCTLLTENLGICHFDACVNCGVFQAAKFLQRAAGVTADGIIGNLTIAAINNLITEKKELAVIHAYLEQRANFYYALVEKDPSQKLFLTGWQNRIANLTGYIDKRGPSDTAVV